MTNGRVGVIVVVDNDLEEDGTRLYFRGREEGSRGDDSHRHPSNFHNVLGLRDARQCDTRMTRGDVSGISVCPAVKHRGKP